MQSPDGCLAGPNKTPRGSLRLKEAPNIAGQSNSDSRKSRRAAASSYCCLTAHGKGVQ
jgi:hypothetical protein